MGAGTDRSVRGGCAGGKLAAAETGRTGAALRATGSARRRGLPVRWTQREHRLEVAPSDRSGATPIVSGAVDLPKTSRRLTANPSLGPRRARCKGLVAPAGGGIRGCGSEHVLAFAGDGRTIRLRHDWTGILKAFDFAGASYGRGTQRITCRFGPSWGYASYPLLNRSMRCYGRCSTGDTDDPSYTSASTHERARPLARGAAHRRPARIARRVPTPGPLVERGAQRELVVRAGTTWTGPRSSHRPMAVAGPALNPDRDANTHRRRGGGGGPATDDA